ncbi:MAG TPA: helix-hairpin-helix domain-containing protein [Polyangiaceae bacterium]|nr:helix-hairpin-helix domain-containing protein [Polyangiaceae bacterium]
MGIFSKIFGNSDAPEAPGADGGQSEASKQDDRDTSPPTRAPSRPEQFAKNNGHATAEASPETAPKNTSPARAARKRESKPSPARAAGAERPSPPELPPREASRSQGAAVQSPRPSIPPRVEATLLSSRAEPEAKPAQAKAATDTAKGDSRKRAASTSKAVAAAPIRSIGARAPAAPQNAAPEPARAAPPPAASAEPARAAALEPQRKPAQAEPLELDPLGQSVAPPPDPATPHDDVDHAFARMVSQAPAAPQPGSLAVDEQTKQANAELFRAMAATHAAPVRDFLLELVVGPSSKLWLDIARPAVESIRRGAVELAQQDLVAALDAFREAMDAATKAVGSKIDGSERDALIRAHAALAAALPQAFDLAKDRDQREPLVVRHLLLQVPGVHKVTIDKLYAAGLASLDALCRSTVDDLVQVGRLERDRADAICSRFRQYWAERASQPVHKTDERARRRLATLLEQLGSAHQAFQRAEADEDREKKRDARSARRASALAINVLLAQLGEVDLVEELERSPTDRRIERVRSYVDVMARARLPQQKEAS